MTRAAWVVARIALALIAAVAAVVLGALLYAVAIVGLGMPS
jgi:hypothetical protein